MRRPSSKKFLVAAASTAAFAGSAGGALAYDGGSYSGGSYGDGLKAVSYQSSYQERDIAGDFAYHGPCQQHGRARLAGRQVGHGPRRGRPLDGRDDDSIKVDWSATGLSGSSSCSR